ncbi:MAG: isopeptide-forming domain-containing fimbrial protein [Faecalibacterium sp.]|nr:isopeptide-forming domain-containing fimbrial protein [Faecalibacterium sp.]
MKKAMKKLMAALLAVAMVCAMAIPAFAEGAGAAGTGTTYTITINNPVGTYEAYQIFSGDLHDGTLSNVAWGTGVSEAGKTALDDAKIRAATLNESNVKAFAEEVSSYLDATSGTYDAGKITGLSAGYYLVKNSSVGEHETYTSFILKVVQNVAVSPKGNKPSLEKKVKDINDTTDRTTSNWQDSADHDIGDEVPFQLTAKIASNFADYKTYKFVFHDVQSAGLDFLKDTVTVKVGNTELTADQYKVITTGLIDDCTFHVVIADLKQIPSAAADAKVVVEYKSKLNENAVIGSKGNPNEAYLEYSNNPHDTNSTTTTPNDKVTVFTFKVVANKTNGATGKALEGAAFALYKKDNAGKWNLVALNNAIESAAGKYTIDKKDKTTFEWVGLDDGTYKISEIITPAGFNSIEDQIFTVTAEHDVTSEDPKLTILSGNATTGTIEFTSKMDEGSLSTTIENNAGTTLPGTGGIGTTIFYVVGGGLMVAAAILLITKKRMENH